MSKQDQVSNPEHSISSTGELTDNCDRDQKNRKKKKEIGGPKGPEPTRYGDWESKGRCYDF